MGNIQRIVMLKVPNVQQKLKGVETGRKPHIIYCRLIKEKCTKECIRTFWSDPGHFHQIRIRIQIPSVLWLCKVV